MTGLVSLRAALGAALEHNPSVRLLGEAVNLSPATQGLQARFSDRVHLLPASDAALVGVALGMAWGGARPIVELSGGPAVWGALQQLGQEAAALGSAELRAHVIVRVPLAPGAVDPSGLLAAVPGLTVLAVGQAGEAAALLDAALQAGGPVVLLEPLVVLAEPVVAEQALPLGKARVSRTGTHATALGWGAGVGAALRAAEMLAEEGVDLEVIDLRSLRPLDSDTVGASVAKTGHAVLVGCGEQALLAAVRAAFLRLESPPAEVQADTDAVVAAVRAALAY